MNIVKIILLLLILSMIVPQISTSQSRIHFAGKNIFISGLNIAWVNFANDIGPGAPDLTQFDIEFQNVSGNGGNVMRFWLNTNGASTPDFDIDGYVTGPGSFATADLKQILDQAQRDNVGLILCLWSHDMLNQSELDTVRLHRNAKLLTDTAYTNAYIRNALIPMVDSVKGHPAIVAWEIFNEPEGISNEYGWGGRDHVPMASIQRSVNLMAGAIHRTDPKALVTSGAVTFQTLTDVNVVAKVSTRGSELFNTFSPEQKLKIVHEFNLHHRTILTVDEYLTYLEEIEPLSNSNFYRDDRLIAAGKDSLGTLDFYCVHYYSQNGASYCPFLFPCSHWKLDKAVVLAEFSMQATNGVASLDLFPFLYLNGYAGAIVWSWTDFGPTDSAADTWLSLNYMYDNYPDDVTIDLQTDIKEIASGVLPTKYSLSQNYPNPFNPTTTIDFSLPKVSNVKLIVYNILGQQVKMILEDRLNPGNYSITFDASSFASGIYFYRLEACGFNSMKKMVLIK